MVHNTCRLFELVFGKKKGIRIENRTIQSGEYVHREFYTYEALFAFWEQEFYQFLLRPLQVIRDLKKIRIYQPAPAGGFMQPIGYTFAIANDNDTQDKPGNSSSPYTTAAHTVSGSDRGLILAMGGGSDNLLSAATYDSVSMDIETQNWNSYSARSVDLCSLIAPSTGSNTGQITASSSFSYVSLSWVSFTGVNQTDLVEASNYAQITYPDTSPSHSVTTVTDNSWVFVHYSSRQNATPTLNIGTAQLYDAYGDASGVKIWGGYNAGTTAGSYEVGWTSADEYGIMGGLAIAPAGASPTNEVKSIAGISNIS